MNAPLIVWIWRLEDWVLSWWPFILMIVAVLAMSAGVVMIARRGVGEHTVRWYCAYCCAIGGIVLSMLTWSGHWPLSTALITFIALVVGESILAFVIKSPPPEVLEVFEVSLAATPAESPSLADRQGE